MAQVIKLKRSESASAAPSTSDLEVGELAMNITDKKLYTKKSDNSIVEIANSSAVEGLGAASIQSIQIINL